MNNSLATVLRILLALILLLFGANKFVEFLPQPGNMSQEAIDFMEAFNTSGYMFKLIGLVEIVSGILLLSNKWVPFALILIAPIVLNIVAFHVALDIDNILPGATISILVIVLFHYNWDKYKTLFNK